jgi:hypothetical protein
LADFYSDNGGAGANPLGLGSDNSFFFTDAQGSPIEIFATGPNGTVSCPGTTGGGAGCDPPIPNVPEPNTLALLAAGLGAMGLLQYGRRRSAWPPRGAEPAPAN